MIQIYSSNYVKQLFWGIPKRNIISNHGAFTRTTIEQDSIVDATKDITAHRLLQSQNFQRDTKIDHIRSIPNKPKIKEGSAAINQNAFVKIQCKIKRT